MTRSLGVLFLSALAAAPAAWAQAEPPLVLLPKQVQAPPADILSGRVRLPDPAAVAPLSRYTMRTVVLGEREDGSWGWSGDVEADGVGVRSAIVWSGDAQLEHRIDWADAQAERVAPVDAAFGVFTAQLIDDPLRAPGPGRIEIVGDGPGVARLVVAFDSPHALRANPTTNLLLAGERVGFAATIVTDEAFGEAATLIDATLEIEGTGLAPVQLLDADGDGVFEGSFVPPAPGQVAAVVRARGITEEGLVFERTSKQLLPIAEGGVSFGPGAMVAGDRLPGSSMVRIDVPAELADASRRVLIAAEVWAREPLAWAATITEPGAAADGTARLSLHVDARWLGGADPGALELRQVRVHDLESFVPVAVAEAMPVTVAAGVSFPADRAVAFDGSMLSGVPRPDLGMAATISGEQLAASRDSSRAFAGHNLLLSHGYCAGGNPWPVGDFSGTTEFFSDPNQNRSHDQFAQLLLAFGNTSKSYGILGHSQGGNAALHLWTFYFSGLDWAEGPRLIQSVGTPYQGTPLASLGGFSCGVNNDLTPAGSANWLSTIPSANRDDVYYWTTQSDGPWCEFLANLVLSSPNDGVVEVARGQLPGGNNMGNTEGQCHTTGMSDPAQYFDATRNADINANAAR